MQDKDVYLEVNGERFGVIPRDFTWETEYGCLPEIHLEGVLTEAMKPTKRKAGIKDVIFNPPATVILWGDGSKTVVKCGEEDVYNPLTGFLLAYMKHGEGGGGAYNNLIRTFVPGYGKEER